MLIIIKYHIIQEKNTYLFIFMFEFEVTSSFLLFLLLFVCSLIRSRKKNEHTYTHTYFLLEDIEGKQLKNYGKLKQAQRYTHYTHRYQKRTFWTCYSVNKIFFFGWFVFWVYLFHFFNDNKATWDRKFKEIFTQTIFLFWFCMYSKYL